MPEAPLIPESYIEAPRPQDVLVLKLDALAVVFREGLAEPNPERLHQLGQEPGIGSALLNRFEYGYQNNDPLIIWSTIDLYQRLGVPYPNKTLEEGYSIQKRRCEQYMDQYGIQYKPATAEPVRPEPELTKPEPEDEKIRQQVNEFMQILDGLKAELDQNKRQLATTNANLSETKNLVNTQKARIETLEERMAEQAIRMADMQQAFFKVEPGQPMNQATRLILQIFQKMPRERISTALIRAVSSVHPDQMGEEFTRTFQDLMALVGAYRAHDNK